LKPNLLENLDFVVVPSEMWSLLRTWYKGGPKIKRQASLVGLMARPQIDLYPVFCHFCLDNRPDTDPVSVLSYQYVFDQPLLLFVGLVGARCCEMYDGICVANFPSPLPLFRLNFAKKMTTQYVFVGILDLCSRKLKKYLQSR
jgi:hypothetical protein